MYVCIYSTDTYVVGAEVGVVGLLVTRARQLAQGPAVGGDQARLHLHRGASAASSRSS